MSQHQQRFQALLRELFQFDSADLDFGIYRITNHKRDVIERYIAEDLPATITEELSRGMLAEQAIIRKQLAEAQEEIAKLLGPRALDSDGNLQQAFHETPVGARYLSLRQRQEWHVARGADVEAFQATVYNHLYNFFSRYYDDGDFISKRRYSRRARYAIPYNGEEVHLHWANKDQHYVKTGRHFRNYTFRVGDTSVRFAVVDANTEQGNLNGAKRYFFPRFKDLTWNEAERRLHIPFAFRPAASGDTAENGENNLQEAIIEKALADLPQYLDSAPLATLSTRRHRNGDRPVTMFEYHLRRYTRRNTTDFFIHKDLKGFLTQEIDFYLKNEVLNIGGVETTDEITAEGWARGWFQTLRLMRTAAGQVIDFLDQAESFQRVIWEKRKFVTDVQYVIPVSLIDERHHSVIAENEAQWTEWRQDLGVDGSTDCDLLDGDPSRLSFLASHPTLTIDTKHFDAAFVDLVLHAIDDLDEITSGLLVHSENQQALALLAESLSDRVDCVYIDPPYNAPSSEIIYKNDYKHSTWLSLMESRIAVTNGMLTDAGIYAIAVDENEQERLGMALSNMWLGGFKRTCVTVRHNPRGIQGANFSHCHDFVYFMYPDDGRRHVGERKLDAPDVRNLRDSGLESRREDARNCFYPIVISPDLVAGFGDVPDVDHHPDANESLEDGSILVWPIDSRGTERKWRYARASVEDIASRLEVRRTKNGLYNVYFAKDTGTVRTIWDDSKFDASEYGTKLLQQLFGTRDLDFSYPKSLYTVMEVVRVSSGRAQAHVLDYFAGSGTTGHAVIALNREDGGDRRFTLVEVEAYFDTVLLPRIKKTMFAATWKAGLPRRETAKAGEWSPGVVKYIRLESYEDALNNIEFDEDGVQRAMQLEDYVIKYMLKWETRDSATLLNVEQLARPFDYKLATHANGNGGTERADVAETFNYLLGLRVRTRRVYYDDERRYLIYRGAADGKETVVIWRETAGWAPEDYRRDQRFLTAQKITEDTDVVYANGVCFLAGAKALEPLFKERMFAPLP